FMNQYLCVALINIDGLPKEQDSSLVSISIKNIVDETMQNYCKFISFPYLDKIVTLLSLDEKVNIMKIIKMLNEVCKIFECVFGSTVSIGIGRIYNNINEIRFSYRTAQSALGYRLILGNGKTIYID
ncbi:DNA-binding response regulator, partial [Clostridium perfringens]|nr:DNA-binding response regulator [Clostridium perfringens]